MSRLRLLDYCRRLLVAAQQPDKVPCVHREGDHTPTKPLWQDRVAQALFVTMAIILGGLGYWLERQDRKLDDIERVAVALAVHVERNQYQVFINKTNIEVIDARARALERYIMQVDTAMQRYLYGRRDGVVPNDDEGGAR